MGRGLSRRCRTLICTVLVAVAFLCGGCEIVPANFQRDATTAGEAFAAAALTLQDEHTGTLTSAYAAAAFTGYQDELSSFARRFPRDPAAPSSGEMRALLAVSAPALRAVAHPCLATTCGWQAQVRSLLRASHALLQAGGS